MDPEHWFRIRNPVPFRTFYPKNYHLALKNIGLGFGIRKNIFPIPDPGLKRHRICTDPCTIVTNTDPNCHSRFNYSLVAGAETEEYCCASWKKNYFSLPSRKPFSEEKSRIRVRVPFLRILTATLCYNYSPVAGAETEEYCCAPWKKKLFLLASRKLPKKIAGSGSVYLCYGSCRSRLNYSPLAGAETQENCCAPRKKPTIFCWHHENNRRKEQDQDPCSIVTYPSCHSLL